MDTTDHEKPWVPPRRTQRFHRRSIPVTPRDGLTPSTAFKVTAPSSVQVPSSPGILWYEYVHIHRHFLTVTTWGPSKTHDTEVALYKPDGTLLFQNDEMSFGESRSRIEKLLPAGTYYIAVGYSDSTFGPNFGASSPARNDQTVLFLKMTRPDSWLNGLPGLVNTGMSTDFDNNYVLTYNDGYTGIGVNLQRIEPDVNWSPNDTESGWIGIESPANSSGTFTAELMVDLSSYVLETLRIEIDIQVAFSIMGFYVNPANSYAPSGQIYQLNDFPWTQTNWSSFTVTNSQLVAGINRFEIKFRGSDPGQKTGFRVRMKGFGTLT